LQTEHKLPPIDIWIQKPET